MELHSRPTTFFFAHLQVQRIELPSVNTFFFMVLVSYFLITSGVIYDVIVEPPAMGQSQDPKTGGCPALRYRGAGSGVGRGRDGHAAFI